MSRDAQDDRLFEGYERFSAMNEVYAEFFPQGAYPARSAVEAANLPRARWWR
jgi:enamine deaminase RidA (YjgF/YER057c/UK114 family)